MPPRGRKWLVLVALGGINLMATLNYGGATTILPVLQSHFGSDVAVTALTLSVYQVVAGSLLLTFGRLGDLRGYRPVVLAGVALFTVSSILCAASPTIGALVASRALQAVGASMLFANSTAILVAAFPSGERGRALGLLSLITYVGLSLGPLVAGWLAQSLSWQFVFLVNVPVAAGLLPLLWRWLPRGRRSAERLDLAGAALLAVGLTAALFTLERAGAAGWSSPLIVGLAVTAAASFAAFVTIELRHPHPVVDLKLFRLRGFVIATTSGLTNYAAFAAVQVLVPYYLIHGRSLGPAAAGAIVAAQPLGQLITAPLSGVLSDRFGTRMPTLVGILVLTGGLGALSGLDASSSLVLVVAALVLVGLGSGTFTTPNTALLLSSTPPERQGTAAAMLGVARYTGFAAGTALASASLGATVASQTALVAGVRAGFIGAMVIALVGTVIVWLGGDTRAKTTGAPAETGR